MSVARVIAIVPALDEQDCIGDVVRGMSPHVARVVVVDNGSRDVTATVAQDAGADLVFEPKRGYGQACLTGLARARALGAEIVIFLDADGSDAPDDAPSLIAPVARGVADLALGVRRRDLREPMAMTHVQAFGNWFGPALMRVALGAPFHDMPPFKACKLASLDQLSLQDAGYGFTIEMLVKAHAQKLRIVEVDVRCRARRGGQSKVSGTVRGASLAALKILWTIARHTGSSRARAIL